jgi:uncharacterized protein YndB with AHSA1/START domain
MPVKRDSAGRRYVETTVEVPGTPEEVWKAVATGRGISSWFVPSQVEERVGGKTISNFGFGPYMEAVATVTTWEPPRRMVAESPPDGPGDPTVATEWTVEARAGGTCVVRVMHTWTADSDKWDDQFEGHSYGWVGFFRILRLYLQNFAGQPCALMQQLPAVSGPKDKAWAHFTGLLGLTGAAPGQRVQSPSGAPRLAGVVEHVGQEPFAEELLLRLEAPAPGLAHLFGMAMGGQVFLTTRLYLYGERAAGILAEEEPRWQAWTAERLLAPPVG